MAGSFDEALELGSAGLSITGTTSSSRLRHETEALVSALDTVSEPEAEEFVERAQLVLAGS